jgi:hypothetical protein
MDPVFFDFIESIKLTSRQRIDAKTKYDGVCKTLHREYYPEHDYSGKTKLLVGSYGKKTNVRPPGDVDVIFKMPDELFDTYDEKENGQSALLQDVRGILNKTYTTTDKISAFGKVVVINFSDGSHNVEVLPAWQQADGSFIIPETSEGGSWSIWNPKADIDALNKSNEATKKTKSLIRLLKKWILVCNVPLAPFKVEILIVNHLKNQYGNNIENVTFIEILDSFFTYLLAIPDSSLTTPSGSYVLLGSDWYSKTQSASSRIQKVISYYSDKKFEACTAELRKVFGEQFPSIEVQKEYLSNQKIKMLETDYPSNDEEFIDSDYHFPIKIDPDVSVVLDSRIEEANGFRKGFLIDNLISRMGYQLPKQASLSFYVKHIDVENPFQIYWKVRNFGDEAKRKDGLRGEITRDQGRREKIEGTMYTGLHLVECYIIKNNVCVAIGRIPVPIGNN